MYCNSCRTSYEAGLKYKVVVDYSLHFNLPLPTKFLDSCAKANKWLPFLVMAQVYDYPHSQVS